MTMHLKVHVQLLKIYEQLAGVNTHFTKEDGQLLHSIWEMNSPFHYLQYCVLYIVELILKVTNVFSICNAEFYGDLVI